MTNDWAAKAAARLEAREGCQCGACQEHYIAKALRRAQAQERARWRKAIKKLQQRGASVFLNLHECRGYHAALDDLAQAMQGRKG